MTVKPGSRGDESRGAVLVLLHSSLPSFLEDKLSLASLHFNRGNYQVGWGGVSRVWMQQLSAGRIRCYLVTGLGRRCGFNSGTRASHLCTTVHLPDCTPYAAECRMLVCTWL
jgi:hypothetical protein